MALSIVDFTAIGIGLGNIAAWSKVIYDARKNGKNGNEKIPCPLHEGLTEEIRTLHKENRDDHQQLFSDIKNLSIAVAGAASAAAAAAVSASAIKRKK